MKNGVVKKKGAKNTNFISLSGIVVLEVDVHVQMLERIIFLLQK